MIKKYKVFIPIIVILLLIAFYVFRFNEDKITKFSELTFYMEESFPYQYSVNGELKGVCFDVVYELRNRLELTPAIKICKWGKARDRALSDKNSCLFSLARIPSREQYYWWIGPIIYYDIAVYKLKKRDDIVIKTIAELNQYNLLMENEHFYPTTILQEMGVNRYTKIDEAVEDKTLSSLNELFAGNADLIVLAKLQAKAMCNYAGYDFNDLEIAYEHESLDSFLYLGLNRNINQKIVERMTNTFEELRSDGTLREILNKYEF